MKRERFRSRLGFLMVSAGCAIGIGNVWKFPYVTGQNGGGVFVLFYLLCLVLMGVPVLTMELAVGRASRKSAVQGYRELEPKGTRWHIHGWFCIVGCILLMMYYTTVTGWMLGYFYKYAVGCFDGVSGDAIGTVFSDMLANPAEMSVYMILAVGIGVVVVRLGLQKGVESVTKWMMVSLLVLMVVLAVHSLTLEDGLSGLKFYLYPDFSRAMEIGLSTVFTSAMNQSFFTLSLGVAAMEIFGSYMNREHTLPGEAVRICGLDTFVALTAGLIIFPACFSYGVEPDAGPSLIFITLPKVFANMKLGRLWGSLFFLFMSFASLTTVIAVFENIMASSIDNFGWSRKKAVRINGILILAASFPCVLGYNLWQNVHPLLGKDILDSEDFLVSNLLLPIGSMIYLMFCVTRFGWGFDKYLKEANTGSGLRFPAEGRGKKLLKAYFTFILPLLILVILVQGLPGTGMKIGVCAAVLCLLVLFAMPGRNGK